MKVSINHVAIVFHVCQFINCIHVDSCEETYVGTQGCVLSIPSFSTQLQVSCGYDYLTIYKLQPKSGNSVNDNYTNFPSVEDVWQKCMKAPLNQGLQNELSLTRVRIEGTRITTFPDYYFCNLRNMTELEISRNSLNDSRKLGFSSIDDCDAPCSTKVDKVVASNNVFETVFNNSFCGLEHLTDLDMTNSNIKVLESDAFINLKSLQTLWLDNNRISIISAGVFRQQESTLKEISLADNRLNSESLQALKYLHKLEYIDLEGNQIEVFYEGMFEGMAQLSDLRMSNNQLKTLTASQSDLTHHDELHPNKNNTSVAHNGDLKNMANLTEIDFSNNPISIFDLDACINTSNLKTVTLSNASLSTVPHFITKLAKLRNLQLSRNQINRINVGAFDEAENIYAIDLSHNRLTDITSVFTNCTVEELYLEYNRLTKLSFTDFGFQLTRLEMTGNHIHTIDSVVDEVDDVAMFVNRWTLESVNLSQNRLNELRGLSLPRSVSDFDVQNNNISFLSYSNSYINLMRDRKSFQLSRMHLQKNAFKVICGSFVLDRYKMGLNYYFSGNPLSCSCENAWLSRRSGLHSLNTMQNIVADRNSLTCEPISQRFGNPHPLKYIVGLDEDDYLCVSLCYCGESDGGWYNTLGAKSQCESLSNKCPPQCVCYTNERTPVIHIDCSSKNILTLPLTPGIQYESLKEIDVYLDNNSIGKINSSSFQGLETTRVLYLNKTNLTVMENGSFDILKDLKVLHLDHNSLSHISEEIFARLSSLTQLFLSHNQIQTVASNAFPSQLQTLYLDNNQLVDYRVWQLQNLTELWEASLHANKWSCECHFIENFRKWLQKHIHIVQDINIFCLQSSGTELQMPLITFNSSYCYNTTSINISLYDYDNMWKWLLGVFICLTITAVLAFVFRREVQVLIYSRLGVRLFYSGEKDELEGKYFDAFIAYSCVDEDFLVNTLMPGLERIDEPYKLCLHHRNFLGGASIINSIMEAVQFSTRTIILLSDNFMRSEWCRFEFQQAYIQMLKDRCNRLLVIIIDEVPADLDPEMRVYLRTNTYLKWGDRLFWKKLYFAMPKRLPQVPMQEFPMQIMD